MAKLQNEEDLGTYRAQAGRIKSQLRLTANIKGLHARSAGVDSYVADFNFYTADPVYIGDKEGFSVKFHYTDSVISEIFAKAKKAEQGIETLLEHGHNDWRVSREVIRCILLLEDQTKHLCDARRKASDNRETKIYGKTLRESHAEIDNQMP